MLNLADLELKNFDISESIIINKRKLHDEQMQVTVSKHIMPLDDDDHIYAETCSVDFYPVSEEEKDFLDKTFLVRITVVGIYQYINYSEDVTLEQLRDIAYKDLFFHLRATMVTSMSSAGMTPYYIPLSFCK